jgi:hypothetical protein
MKLVNAIIISSALVVSSVPAFAGSNEQEIEHSKHHPAAASETTVKDTAPKQESMPMMTDMSKHMEKMQALMQSIHQEKSPEKRAKLMQQHMEMMQGCMTMMSDMSQMNDMKSMSGMQKDSADTKMDGMPGAVEGKTCKMSECMEAMQQHMKMMQQMMDQMMQHMAAME